MNHYFNTKASFFGFKPISSFLIKLLVNRSCLTEQAFYLFLHSYDYVQTENIFLRTSGFFLFPLMKVKTWNVDSSRWVNIQITRWIIQHWQEIFEIINLTEGKLLRILEIDWATFYLIFLSFLWGGNKRYLDFFSLGQVF